MTEKDMTDVIQGALRENIEGEVSVVEGEVSFPSREPDMYYAVSFDEIERGDVSLTEYDEYPHGISGVVIQVWEEDNSKKVKCIVNDE